MIIKDWLNQAQAKLNQTGVGSAQLDALILLEDELKKERAHLLAHPEIALSKIQMKNLEIKLKRRLKHEPLAYIRGFSEFYGRKFLIDKRVLEPRPESETMMEMLLKLPRPKSIADVGTGSGALAITAKLELPKAEVFATEIDKKALEVAKQNAKKLNVSINFYAGNLLEPIEEPIEIILANLPYVPDDWQINEAAAMEPRVAIFGGPDGLDLYRRMFKQIENFSWQPKYILTESLPPQHKELARITIGHGYRLEATRDFIQVFVSN